MGAVWTLAATSTIAACAEDQSIDPPVPLFGEVAEAVDVDHVRQFAGVVGSALRQRHARVQAKMIAGI